MKFRFLYFALAPFLSSLILIFYFDINPFLDISRYYFQGDGLLSQKYIKNLIINSSFFCSKQLAYPVLDTNCFRDFVLDHLYLNILIIFLIKFFTNDPLLIVLIYDFFCIIFIALITNVVLLKFSISKTLSCLISIFFAVSQNQVNFINQIGPSVILTFSPISKNIFLLSTSCSEVNFKISSILASSTGFGLFFPPKKPITLGIALIVL